MARRSYYGGIVRSSAVYNLAGESVDTQYARVLANNAMHYADEDGQILVWKPGHPYGDFSTSYSGTTPTKVTSFGPLRLRLKPSLDAYQVRVRFYGGTGGAGTCKVWVVLGSEATAKFTIAIAELGSPNAIYGVPTGTAGWVTTYNGLGDATTLIAGTGLVDVARNRDSIISLGGDSSSVNYLSTNLSVWVQGTSGSGSFTLRQIYAAEVY